MSSDTDHPRQRTVAELLAAHGGDAPTSGRRRRRREDDGDAAPVERSAAPPAPDRSRESTHRVAAQPQQARSPQAPSPQAPPQSGAPRRAPQPVSAPRPAGAPPVRRDPPPQAPAPSSGSSAQPVPPSAALSSGPSSGSSAQPAPPSAGPSAQPAAFRSRPAGPPRDRPTDVLPRVRDAERGSVSPVLDGGPDDDGGPATMVGAAPVGAEAWHRVRTGAERGSTGIDGGPPLAPGPIEPGEGPAGLGGGPDSYRNGHGPGAPGRDRFDQDDEHDRDGGDRDEHDRDRDGDDFDSPPPRERRLGRSSAAPVGASAWGAVIVQWIAGALGGAILWVAFRFLWRNLPVVAVAAAAIVTIGLVLVVRALLHNEDRRTTVLAVLVGLLLTVSPVILVLMGR